MYQLFGKTGEPGMIVENRANLRLWMAKGDGSWRVATYDYHVRVPRLPADQPARSRESVRSERPGEPFDVDEFVR